ncbi:MAG: hypothetical protein HWN66_16940 [Candidatus Helarchaeota archaeon]|nr:hypothetical protein [Candidatus Helarchaeota archaeon]
MTSFEERKIAKSAQIENSDIKAKKVIIGEDVVLKNIRIEAETFIVGKNTRMNDCILLSNGEIQIGKYVQVKENSVLKAFRGVKVGHRTIIDRGVLVAGLQSEYSYFEIGNSCVLLHHSYVNCAREVIIGNKVGIGGYCLIFTHGVWQNAFKGFPVKYGKVVIKDEAWLPWHVFVMPGVTIGKGATIGGGSVIRKDIPDYALAIGDPPKIIARDWLEKGPKKETKHELLLKVINEFRNFFYEYIGNKSIKIEEENDYFIKIKTDMGNLIYISDNFNENLQKVQEKEFDLISLEIPDKIKRNYNWIEIDTELKSEKNNKLSLEFIEYLRRYGVKISDIEDQW